PQIWQTTFAAPSRRRHGRRRTNRRRFERLAQTFLSEPGQTSKNPMYDLIGDIHGHAAPLQHLLTRLGYNEIKGVWQHPERKVIFLGDFVDRGPAQVETVRIARDMVESGHALAVMGNHEFNAVAWAMVDPENPETFLRPHTDKNRNQHQAFLDQVEAGSS